MGDKVFVVPGILILEYQLVSTYYVHVTNVLLFASNLSITYCPY